MSTELIRAREEERESLEHLAKLVEVGELSFQGNFDRMDIPESIRIVLVIAIDELAKGNAVSVVPVHAQLTPRQAAELLGVSRPYVVRLLDEGRIPATRVGAHRRLLLSDVLAFKQGRDAARRRGLDELAKESERLGIK